MVSRAQGYRAGAGKEGPALAVVEAFFEERFGIPLSRITDPEENFRIGDFRLPDGATIECKGQPIDPGRYPENFVELFEVTTNARHAGVFEHLCRLLNVSPPDLAALRLWDGRNGSWDVVGTHENVSVSVTSIAAASHTVYVNPSNGGTYLYLYEREELLDAIRARMRAGLLRGVGRSNDDTFAVKAALARARWASSGATWEWIGDGSEESIRSSFAMS